jgi:hypothetical protein
VTAWNIHEVEVGLAIGALGGIALGYELRKLVVRFQAWRKKGDRITRRDVKRAYKQDRIVDFQPVTEKAKPMHLPRIRVPSPSPSEPWDEMPSADRADVIGALVGAGYKRAEAAKAVDACSLPERAAGLESWTMAALRRASGL